MTNTLPVGGALHEEAQAAYRAARSSGDVIPIDPNDLTQHVVLCQTWMELEAKKSGRRGGAVSLLELPMAEAKQVFYQFSIQYNRQTLPMEYYQRDRAGHGLPPAAASHPAWRSDEWEFVGKLDDDTRERMRTAAAVSRVATHEKSWNELKTEHF